jgi:hypothetical protein
MDGVTTVNWVLDWVEGWVLLARKGVGKGAGKI